MDSEVRQRKVPYSSTVAKVIHGSAKVRQVEDLLQHLCKTILATFLSTTKQ